MNHISTSLFHRIFKKLKFSIDSTYDGFETIKMYKQAYNSNQPYDILILDLIIPGGIGGFETFQRISEFDPQVKAVVSSGYSNDPIIANYKKYWFSCRTK